MRASWFVSAVATIHCAVAARSRQSSYSHYTSSSPNVTFLEPQYFKHYGSERVEIKYGPFLVPSSNDNNGMKTFDVRNATKPCDNCLITWMQAGLQYPDGSVANSDTGMWLHHVLATNRDRRSQVCPTEIPERFFASGNERTVIDICVHGTQKTGYFLSGSDRVYLAPELMNEMGSPRLAVVTITYEYIPYLPSDFSLATPVWLDVTGACGSSEAPVPNASTFSLAMDPPWTSNITGRISFAATHLHDGGIDLRITRNNRTVCDAISRYGETPGYVEGNTTMVMNSTYGMDMVHISSMSSCHGLGSIRVGDKLAVQAEYNLTAHPPMMDGDGTPTPVMGIALLYIAQDYD